MKQLLTDFAEGLYGTQGFNAAFAQLDHYIQQLGFDGVRYTRILLLLPPEMWLAQGSDSFSPAFLDEYEKRNLQNDDFIIKAFQSPRQGRIDWWGETKQRELLTAEKNVIEVARYDHGIAHGFSVKTIFNQDELSGASVISRENDASYQKLFDEKSQIAEFMLQIFHGKVSQSLEQQRDFVQPLYDRLTLSQRKVLWLHYAGKPRSASKQLIGLATRSLDNIEGELMAMTGADNMLGVIRIFTVYRLLSHADAKNTFSLYGTNHHG